MGTGGCTSTTGAAAPTARMAPVPGGRIAPNWLTPNMPRLDTVKVPASRGGASARGARAVRLRGCEGLDSADMPGTMPA